MQSLDTSSLLKLPFRHWQEIVPPMVLERKRFAIFDTVGIGKTIEALGSLAAISRYGKMKAIIIAESSNVMQWSGEVEKFTDFKCFTIAGSKTKKNRTNTYKEFFYSESPSVLLINYGKLRFDFDIIRKLKANCVIYDEAAILSNINQTASFARWLNAGMEYVIALTATPISRDITQFYLLFDVMGITPMSREEFLESFAVYNIERVYTRRGKIDKLNITGAKNIDRLKEVYGPFYIRRRKQDVKKESELVIRNYYYTSYEMSKEQKVMYSHIKDRYLQIYRDGQLEAKELEPLTAYTATIQSLCSPYLMDNRKSRTSPKIDGLKVILESLPKKDKCVIYTKFLEFGSMVEDLLPPSNTVFLNGVISSEEFEARKTKFVEDPECLYCVVTDVAEKGLNLQVANNIVFLSLPFTPDSVFQLIGRIDREGQESPFINIWFCLMENTIEESLFKDLRDRQAVFDAVFDTEGAQHFDISREDFIKLL